MGGNLDAEVDARTKGYKDALALLAGREFVLDEALLALWIDKYDSEREVFVDARIESRRDELFHVLWWDFPVPISLAEKFEKSVEAKTIKLRADARLDADGQIIKFERVLIEDMLQERQFGPYEIESILQKRIESLVSQFDSPNGNEAISGLGWIGAPAIPALERALNDINTFHHPASALAKIGSPAVAVLIKALARQDPTVRQKAAYALGQIGKPARAAFPHLLKAYSIRGVSDALNQIGGPTKDEIPLLIRALENENQSIRRYAASSLLQLAEPTLAPTFIKALEHKDSYVRHSAAEALGKIGQPARAAFPHLLKALGDQSPYVRGHASSALSQIGGPTKDEIPLLIRALENENQNIRHYASSSLYQLAEPTLVPTFIKALEHKDPYVRYGAALALGQIGEPAKETFPHLLKALADQGRLGGRYRYGGRRNSPYVYEAASQALQEIGGPTQGDVPILINALDIKNENVRRYAIDALKKFGTPEARQAVTEFEKSGGR